MLLAELLVQLLLRLANQREITVTVEVVVCLQQDNVVATFSLFMIELLYCLKVLLLKVLVLELQNYLVLFFKLVEPLSEHSQIRCHFLCRL